MEYKGHAGINLFATSNELTICQSSKMVINTPKILCILFSLVLAYTLWVAPADCISIADTSRTIVSLNGTQKVNSESVAIAPWLDYDNPTLGMSLNYPPIWSIANESGNTISISPSNDSKVQVILNITRLPVSLFESANLNDIVSKIINDLKIVAVDGWRFYGANETQIDSRPAFQLISTNGTYYSTWFLTLTNDFVYYIKYQADEQNYVRYASTIGGIVKSISIPIQSTQQKQVLPGLKTGNYPQGLALDPSTDTLYVANYGSNTISSISLKSVAQTKNGSSGSKPHQISFIPSKNILYVTNFGQDSVSIHDGQSLQQIGEIPVGRQPIFIAADNNLNEPLVFVSNRGSNSVTVISDEFSKQIDEIKVGSNPYGIDVNPITNRIYIANSNSNSTTVVDYFFYNFTHIGIHNITKIPVGVSPSGVSVDTALNLIYVTNLGSNNIAIINGSSNTVIRNISGINHPWFIDVNPKNHLVFVTSQYSKELYKINGTDQVGRVKFEVGRPRDVLVDPRSDIVYVTNDIANMVYSINATSLKPMVYLDLVTHPPYSGKIICSPVGNTESSRYVYDYDSSIKCYPAATSGFKFSYWSGSLSKNLSNSTQISFQLKGSGILSASFERSVEPVTKFINENYGIIYFVITGLILTPIAGYLLQYAWKRIERKRQLKYLRVYLQFIDKAYEDNINDKAKCVVTLDEKGNEILKLLKEGIINESTYRLLKDRIQEMEKKL